MIIDLEGFATTKQLKVMTKKTFSRFDFQVGHSNFGHRLKKSGSFSFLRPYRGTFLATETVLIGTEYYDVNGIKLAQMKDVWKMAPQVFLFSISHSDFSNELTKIGHAFVCGTKFKSHFWFILKFFQTECPNELQILNGLYST